jgi:hypothetical protein
MRRIGLFAAAVLLVLAGSAAAEDILLKDGTKVSGKIIGVKDDTFQVKTSYGEMQIPRSDIVSISFPENQPPKPAEEELPAIDEKLEGTRYLNRTGNFQLSVPEGWSSAIEELRKQGAKDIVAGLASPDRTLFLLVGPEKYSGSLNSYRGLVEVQFQSQWSNYEKLSETEVTLDGKTGRRLIVQGKNKAANDAPLKSLVFILPYEGKMVRLTFLTLEPLFEEALPIFEKIAKTYKSTQP